MSWKYAMCYFEKLVIFFFFFLIGKLVILILIVGVFVFQNFLAKLNIKNQMEYKWLLTFWENYTLSPKTIPILHFVLYDFCYILHPNLNFLLYWTENSVIWVACDSCLSGNIVQRPKCPSSNLTSCHFLTRNSITVFGHTHRCTATNF